jgi:hypothetical protein
MAVELSDDEAQHLRSEAAKAAAIEKDLAAAKQRAEAAEKLAQQREQAHRSDMDAVRNYLVQNNMLPGQAPPAKVEQPPDDAFVSQADLRRINDAQRAELANTAAQIATSNFIAQRSTNRAIAESRLPNFAAHAEEVEAELNKLQPAVAAHPDAYNQVYNWVVKRKLKPLSEMSDDELETERRRRNPDLAAEGESGEPSASPPEPSASPSPTPSAIPRVPLPPIAGSPVTRSTGSRVGQPKLPPDQARMAAKWGLTATQWLENYGDSQEETDIFGMKGRKRV